MKKGNLNNKPTYLQLTNYKLPIAHLMILVWINNLDKISFTCLQISVDNKTIGSLNNNIYTRKSICNKTQFDIFLYQKYLYVIRSDTDVQVSKKRLITKHNNFAIIRLNSKSKTL